MIKPHGAEQLMPLYVADEKQREALRTEAASMPSVVVSSAAATNAVMLAGGYFTPLTGFMNVADAMSVAKSLHTADGLFWPVPVMNLLPSDKDLVVGETLALRDPNVDGNPVLAVMKIDAVETLSDSQIETILQEVFGTQDEKHPGVAAFKAQGNVAVSGPIQVLNFSYFASDFPDTFRTAVQIREQMQELGWEKVVAFQTRNPMHRAHEELCRMAMQDLGADGCLVHMLLGKLKPGDIPADVRDASIRKMVELYFEPNTVLVTGYGFDMLYAGPREAVLHAVFRQNCGCTHLIVGRDHAGVGDYYGAFDA